MIHNPNINKPRRSSKFAKAPSCASKGTISISRVKPLRRPAPYLGDHVAIFPRLRPARDAMAYLKRPPLEVKSWTEKMSPNHGSIFISSST